MKKSRYIAPLIMLLAGTINSIYQIVQKSSLTHFLVSLLLVLLIFYGIGLVVRILLLKISSMEVKFVSQEKKDDGAFVDLTKSNQDYKDQKDGNDSNLYEEDD